MDQTIDERETELSSISAIFPEIVLDSEDSFTASIDLPVVPLKPVPTLFSAASQSAPPPLAHLAEPLQQIHLITHLPSLHLRISLPEGYPILKPPIFEISTSPKWLSSTVVSLLLGDGTRLWEEFGHDQVVFAYIDHLQQAAENVFGLLNESEILRLFPDHEIELLDYDEKAKQATFEKGTYDCGVCLEPKKGSACHKMLDCGHIYCRRCLQDYYNNAIAEGDLTVVRCLAPDCAKKRTEAARAMGKLRKAKVHISPSELLQIPLEQGVVKRYVTLKHKSELESDKNTIYCPRIWCQGAARSQKHKKPGSWEETDEDSDDEGSKVAGPSNQAEPREELLSVCEDCDFAFCRRCFQGWHGRFTQCTPKVKVGELSEDDKASLEYLKLHTTPCPTCDAPAQKTHGCNHMICFRCDTHYCYLCSAWLQPDNPYGHFSATDTFCYMRLWEGDENQADNGQVVRPVHDNNDNEGINDFENNRDNNNHDREVEEEEGPHPDVLEPVVPLGPVVAREGPLVLRINRLPPRPPTPPPALPAPPLRQRAPPIHVDADFRIALNRADWRPVEDPRRNERRPVIRERNPFGQVRQGVYEERPAGRRHLTEAAAHRAAAVLVPPAGNAHQRPQGPARHEVRHVQDVHAAHQEHNPRDVQVARDINARQAREQQQFNAAQEIGALPAQDQLQVNAQQEAEARQAQQQLDQQRGQWIQDFVLRALNDEEEEEDSDLEEGEDAAWEIPLR